MSGLCRTLLFLAAALLPAFAHAQNPPPEEFVWDHPDGFLPNPSPGIQTANASNIDGLLGFLSLTLDPPPTATAAALTLIVPGSSGGFIRALLDHGNGDAFLLSPDLREHTGLPEQILLILPTDQLGPGSTVEFHSSQPNQAFLRVAVAWLHTRELLTTPSDRSPRVLFQPERIKHQDETNEGVPLLRRDRVLSRSVDAVLHTPPLRADEGAEFAFDLASVPETAAFRAEVTGAHLGEPLELWVNGHGPVLLTPPVPPLNDPGIFRQGDTWTYIGWRPLSLFIQPDWLMPGENMVVIQRTQTGAELPPLALKDVRFEFLRPPTVPAHEPEPLPASNPQDIELPLP